MDKIELKRLNSNSVHSFCKQNVSNKEPGDDPFYIPVGRSPVTALCLIESQLWCACGNNVHILHAEYVMKQFLNHSLT